MKIRYVIKYKYNRKSWNGSFATIVEDHLKDNGGNLITFESSLDCLDYIEENKLQDQYELLFIETIVE